MQPPAKNLARRTLFKFGASLLMLAAFLVFCVLHALDLRLYEALVALPDTFVRPHPFYDLRDILRGGVCWRRGVNVYAPSACMGGGVFNYSPLLLRAALLPIGVGDRVPGGILCCLMFIASLSWLPAPKSMAEFAFTAFCALSTTTMYALEQGNFDIVIFAVSATGIAWLCRRPAASPLSFGLFALAAACKFYPAALFALVLREPFWKFTAMAGTLLCGFLLYIALFGRNAAAALAILPQSTPFRATFGATDLPLGLDMLRFAPFRAATAWHADRMLVRALTDGLTLLGLMLAVAKARSYEACLSRLDPARKLFCIGGAVIIAACFFAAQNVEYRGIFLLLTIPGLWRMAADGSGLPPRRLAAGVPILLWEAVPRHLLAPRLAEPFWLFREALWWWVAIQLTAIAICFATTELSRLGRESRPPQRHRTKITKVFWFFFPKKSVFLPPIRRL